ncbi:DNA-binding protein [Kaistia algarum]|uniref:S24 family peptidase n=1 Tax=Kaistia algarum TaxID=2083279 RepID=UPI000CE8E990|nr:helix-turn-helix transcriptional regulator [Kaistia algarum]MCX5513389.1 helix-turn-helix transcriptional regulator [Kaistia algarum]PPE81975.1 DNA-binding protein [Kaistia algarum]
MLSHERIWAAIDRLAERNALTASGLARKAGLDPTTFNRSKRVASDGRLRWPSTESIAKVLEATGEPIDRFLSLLAREVDVDSAEFHRPLSQMPLIGFAKAGVGGFFDDGGLPAGQGWDEVASSRRVSADGVYALEVSGDSMLPLYREGDVIIVSPTAACRPGDRVVLRTQDGEVMAKVFACRSETAVELSSLSPGHPVRIVQAAEIEWMARIIWASQ